MSYCSGMEQVSNFFPGLLRLPFLFLCFSSASSSFPLLLLLLICTVFINWLCAQVALLSVFWVQQVVWNQAYNIQNECPICCTISFACKLNTSFTKACFHCVAFYFPLKPKESTKVIIHIVIQTLLTQDLVSPMVQPEAKATFWSDLFKFRLNHIYCIYRQVTVILKHICLSFFSSMDFLLLLLVVEYNKYIILNVLRVLKDYFWQSSVLRRPYAVSEMNQGGLYARQEVSLLYVQACSAHFGVAFNIFVIINH